MDSEPTPNKPLTNEPDKKKTQLLLIAIVSAVIVLAIAVLVVVVVLLNRGPDKQAYQDTVQTTLNLGDKLRDVTQLSISRQVLETGLTDKRNTEISDDVLNRTNFRGVYEKRQMTPHLLVDEKSLEDIEAKERTLAKEIDQNRDTLDEQIKQFDDETIGVYHAFHDAWSNTYDKRTATQFNEATIQMKRTMYACMGAFMTYDSISNSPHDAKVFTMWGESCRVAAQKAIDSNALLSDQQVQVTHIRDFMNDAVVAMFPFIEQNKFGEKGVAKMKAIQDKYKDVFSENAIKPLPSIDGVTASLDELRNHLVSKRDKASGDYAAPADDTSAPKGIRF